MNENMNFITLEKRIDKYLIYNAYKGNSFCTIPMPDFLNDAVVSQLIDVYRKIGWNVKINDNDYEWEFSISED